MCALAAAVPEHYLAGSTSTSTSADRFPPRELEFDARGRVEVSPDSSGSGGHALCDVGEVKSGANFASVVPQLGHRLRALAWVVATTQGRADLNIRLIGRLFLPKGVICDESHKRTALQAWHYSLYVHHI